MDKYTENIIKEARRKDHYFYRSFFLDYINLLSFKNLISQYAKKNSKTEQEIFDIFFEEWQNSVIQHKISLLDKAFNLLRAKSYVDENELEILKEEYALETQKMFIEIKNQFIEFIKTENPFFLIEDTKDNIKNV